MMSIEMLNRWGDSWASFVLAGLLESSLALALVAVLWLAIRRRIEPQVGYWLFALVLLKLTVPASLTGPEWLANLSPRSLMERAIDSSAPTDSPAPVMVADSTDEFFLPVAASQVAALPAGDVPAAAPKRTRLSTSAALMLVWIVGMVALATRMLLSQWRMIGLLRDAEPLSLAGHGIDFDRLRRQAGIRRPVRLLVGPEAASPMAVGITRPTVLLPPGLASELASEQLRWVLLHELAHLKRRDNLAALAQRLIGIAWFFNPAVWIANGMMDRLREFACDDMALAWSGASRRDCGHGFVRVVERVAAEWRPVPSLGLFDGKGAIKSRLVRLLDPNRRPRIGASFGGGALLIVTAAFLLPAVHAEPKPDAQPTTPKAAAKAASKPLKELDIVAGWHAQQPTRELRTSLGRVVASDGKPALGAHVGTAIRWTKHGPELANPARVDKEGRFTINHKPGRSVPPFLLAHDPESDQLALIPFPAPAPAPATVFGLASPAIVQGTIECPELGGLPADTALMLNVLRRRSSRGSSFFGERTAARLNYLDRTRFPLSSQRFSLRLPIGQYEFGTSSEETIHRRFSVNVEEGQAEVDMGTIELTPTFARSYQGKAPPKLTVTDARGVDKGVQLSDFKGKWVLLAFWNGKGLRSPIGFQRTHAGSKEKFQLLAFYDLPAASVTDVIGDYDSPVPILVDSTGATSKTFRVDAGWQNRALLIDPLGRVMSSGSAYDMLAEALPIEAPAAVNGAVLKSLDLPVTFEFQDTPIHDVVAFLRDYTDVTVVLDPRTLAAAKITSDAPVTLTLRDVTLEGALTLLLEPLGLMHIADGGALKIINRPPGPQRPREDNPAIIARNAEIARVLRDKKCSFQFTDTPFYDAFVFFRDFSDLNIVIDRVGLRNAGMSIDKPITATEPDVPLGKALTTSLDSIGLAYIVRDEVVFITPKANAKE